MPVHFKILASILIIICKSLGLSYFFINFKSKITVILYFQLYSIVVPTGWKIVDSNGNLLPISHIKISDGKIVVGLAPSIIKSFLSRASR